MNVWLGELVCRSVQKGRDERFQLIGMVVARVLGLADPPLGAIILANSDF